MAPPHHRLHLSPPPLPPSAEHHRRCSKAQMCFFQILHIISAFPSPDNNCLTSDDEIRQNLGFIVDLNIRLRPLTTEEETDSYELELPPTTAHDGDDAVGENCVFEKNDHRCETESESVVADGSAVEEERLTEHSEISHVGDQSSDEGCYNLGLLIDAAQLILGDDSEPDVKPLSHQAEPRTEAPARGAKRKAQCWTAAAEAEWYAEFEDTSPVVKSKRGRNQVLPFRYRDSVVEPLVRWTTSGCKSISKRRSK